MYALRSVARPVIAAVIAALAACGDSSPTVPNQQTVTPGSCPGINLGPRPAALTLQQSAPATMTILGNGAESDRYSAEVAVRGSTAYTTTWNVRRAQGNKINIWDVSGNVPVLVDSVIVAGAITTGDVAISDDGKLLVVATEFSPGSIAIYDLANPRKPQLLSRFSNDQTTPGVHTAELGRVNGILYAFLSIDAGSTGASRIVIVDLTIPSAPKQAFVKIVGGPFVHDTYARDGLLFLGLWNEGMDIWDIGGCGTGASPESPRVLGNVKTIGGSVHNIWWYHDPNGSKRFAFVGEEGPASIGTTSRGDVHVIDITDPTAPKEVAFYHVAGAGAHNFSVDETNGVFYAAFYNGGVRALDIRGDLAACSASQQATDAASGLVRCDLRLMGRELAIGVADVGRNVSIWGVQHLNGNVYASDMLNGIWKLGAVK